MDRSFVLCNNKHNCQSHAWLARLWQAISFDTTFIVARSQTSTYLPAPLLANINLLCYPGLQGSSVCLRSGVSSFSETLIVYRDQGA